MATLVLLFTLIVYISIATWCQEAAYGTLAVTSMGTSGNKY